LVHRLVVQHRLSAHAFFWKGVLAVIIWPYYLGAALAH